MPFTFSHPAIVLPFKYLWIKRFSTTGLIVGSMTPDFEYFVRFENWSVHSHRFSAVLWFDMPLGLFLCFIFHEVVKGPLFNNLPDFLRCRLMRFNSFDWKKYFRRRWLTVLYSLLLGIISHLVWDRLTHQTYGLFEGKPLHMRGHTDFFPTPAYRIIQISYSLFGLAVLTYLLLRLPPKETSKAAPRHPFWIALGFFSLSILGSAIIFTGLEFMDWITAPISSAIFALIATSLLTMPDKSALLRGWNC